MQHIIHCVYHLFEEILRKFPILQTCKSLHPLIPKYSYDPGAGLIKSIGLCYYTSHYYTPMKPVTMANSRKSCRTTGKNSVRRRKNPLYRNKKTGSFADSTFILVSNREENPNPIFKNQYPESIKNNVPEKPPIIQ